MTPEEIIEAFATGIILLPEHSQAAKDKAIENMKQWGREMCDKQKDEILCYGDDHDIYSGRDIRESEYPKELQ